MKRSLALWVFVSLYFVGVCQDSAFSISKVVKTDHVSQKELFRRAKAWMAHAYEPAKKASLIYDTAFSTVGVKSEILVIAENDLMSRLEEGIVSYTLTIECHDDGYLYKLKDFTHEGILDYGSGGNLNNRSPDCGSFKMTKLGWNNIKAQSAKYISKLEASLASGMNDEPATASDKW